MREIKFRGLEVSTGSWVVGSHVKTGADLHYIVPQNVIGSYMPEYHVKKETVGQFTGLHDKNGKEIFEGDLVLNHRNAHSKEILQVKWQEGESKQADDGIWWTHKKPGFVFERINPGMHTVYVAEKDFEVIGNIFENEDLLS